MNNKGQTMILAGIAVIIAVLIIGGAIYMMGKTWKKDKAYAEEVCKINKLGQVEYFSLKYTNEAKTEGIFRVMCTKRNTRTPVEIKFTGGKLPWE